MEASTEMITTGQLKMIWGLARKAAMDEEMVHSFVKSIAGVDSLKKLNKLDAIRVIDRLKGVTGDRAEEPGDRANKGQISVIYGLARKLGWMDDPKRLKTFLEKRYGVSHPRFLTDKDTRNVIEAMKAMLKGGRGERKKADGSKNT